MAPGPGGERAGDRAGTAPPGGRGRSRRGRGGRTIPPSSIRRRSVQGAGNRPETPPPTTAGEGAAGVQVRPAQGPLRSGVGYPFSEVTPSGRGHGHLGARVRNLGIGERDPQNQLRVCVPTPQQWGATEAPPTPGLCGIRGKTITRPREVRKQESEGC